MISKITLCSHSSLLTVAGFGQALFYLASKIMHGVGFGLSNLGCGCLWPKGCPDRLQISLRVWFIAMRQTHRALQNGFVRLTVSSPWGLRLFGAFGLRSFSRLVHPRPPFVFLLVLGRENKVSPALHRPTDLVFHPRRGHRPPGGL